MIPFRLPHNGRLLLSALASEAAGSLRSPAAHLIVRRSRSATRYAAATISWFRNSHA